MVLSVNQNNGKLYGVLFVACFAIVATILSRLNFFQQLAISPLIIGIIIGMVFANTLRSKMPVSWQSGILFSTKIILRLAIVFYGFRLTFQNIADVGLAGIFVASMIISSTFILGYLIGTKYLKLDRDTTILICAGSSICGAAAVLATEPVINAAPYKSAIAVATVVIFGCIAMFLYPYLYHTGILHFDDRAMGIYIGGTLHEVAHVVAAGHAINDQVANNAVIVKMLRVMLLAPFLIILGVWLTRAANQKFESSVPNQSKKSITIPWFAVGFIAIAGVNSLHLIPMHWVAGINSADTFALTMAMTALGMETQLHKFKGVGLKPLYLASILFAWLLIAGYFFTSFAVNVF